MTTIAYRDGILAGDQAIFDRDTYCGQTVKIHRAGCGAIGGVAGCFGDLSIFREWMNNGAVLKLALTNPPEFQHLDSEALVIDTDGSVYWIGHGKRWVQQCAPFFALGSGFRIAMGALAAGASASKAVLIACDLDAYTRGPVNTLKLDGPQGVFSSVAEKALSYASIGESLGKDFEALWPEAEKG